MTFQRNIEIRVQLIVSLGSRSLTRATLSSSGRKRTRFLRSSGYTPASSTSGALSLVIGAVVVIESVSRPVTTTYNIAAVCDASPFTHRWFTAGHRMLASQRALYPAARSQFLPAAPRASVRRNLSFALVTWLRLCPFLLRERVTHLACVFVLCPMPCLPVRVTPDLPDSDSEDGGDQYAIAWVRILFPRTRDRRQWTH